MAVYTDVSDGALQVFLRDYDVGVVQAFKGIAEGVENSNYFLSTERGSFILTLYERRTKREELPYFLALMAHLAAKKLPCPLPVARRDGGFLGELEGRPAALITFLPGLSLRKPNAQHCARLGRVLAKMHKGAKDFPNIRLNAMGLASWQELIGAVGAQADTLMSGLSARLGKALERTRGEWPTELPTGTVHADLFPNNVLFMGDKISGLIDFYFAATDMLAYDIAICLNAWCFEPDGAFNVTKGAAMLKGYQAVRKLTPDEITALPALCRGAALRFIATRLYDWFHVPPHALVRPHDPLEYVRKLRFHEDVVDARDYGLAE